MRPGSQSNDEYLCIFVSKTWHRFRPIFLVLEGFSFLNADFLPPLHQSLAFSAGNNFVI